MSIRKRDQLQLTSVKLLPHLYHEFKVMTIQTGFSFQKLVNRALYLYLNDERFREGLHKTKQLQISGSNF